MRIGFEWNKMEINLVRILIFIKWYTNALTMFPEDFTRLLKICKKIEISHLNAEMTNIKY